MENTGKRYIQNPNFIYRQIVDEMILVPIHHDVADMDSIFSLNSVGAFIWEKLEKPLTISEIEQAIMDAFDADPATVRQDIDAFFEAMHHYGAIQEAV